MKKKVIISILSIILILLVFASAYYFFIFEKEVERSVSFKLNEPLDQTIEVGSSYNELGAKVICDNNDITKDLKIDNSNLDINKIGIYKVKYYVIIDKKEYNHYRTVSVVDTTKPEIKLIGNDTINLLVGETYKDEGATATDNYDGDITKDIKVEGNVDTSKVGKYKITYSISDSSNNTNSIERVVSVQKPKPVIIVNNTENKEVVKEVDPFEYSNTITGNSFTNTGFYIEGYKKDNDNTFKILFEGENNYTFDLSSIGSSKYNGNINLNDVANGNYNLFIESNTKERLLNKLEFIDRIKRSKVGDKLVTFDYNDAGEVSINISDFAYQYDVVIDPGHGGEDTGASNEYIYEKDMNLVVSKYEKCRFESHGYKVYMTRNDDTYGTGIGPSSAKKLQRRAYEMGYIGVVSKVVYSNHHNAIGNNYFSGYEILLPGHLTAADLASELAIVNKFNTIYDLKESHMRFYARDYVTETKYSKLNGEVYSFKDNYAVNRIPFKLFNTKSVIYEGCYLTNKEDFVWYWNQKNWINVSETKLEVYINYLGGTYDSDNSSCL